MTLPTVPVESDVNQPAIVAGNRMIDDAKIGGDIPVTLAAGLTTIGIVGLGVAPWFLLKFAEVAVEGLAIG